MRPHTVSVSARPDRPAWAAVVWVASRTNLDGQNRWAVATASTSAGLVTPCRVNCQAGSACRPRSVAKIPVASFTRVTVTVVDDAGLDAPLVSTWAARFALISE